MSQPPDRHPRFHNRTRGTDRHEEESQSQQEAEEEYNPRSIFRSVGNQIREGIVGIRQALLHEFRPEPSATMSSREQWEQREQTESRSRHHVERSHLQESSQPSEHSIQRRHHFEGHHSRDQVVIEGPIGEINDENYPRGRSHHDAVRSDDYAYHAPGTVVQQAEVVAASIPCVLTPLTNTDPNRSLIRFWCEMIDEYAEVIGLLDRENPEVGGREARNYLKDVSKHQVEQMINRLCQEVKGMLCREDRVIRISSPVVIFGDIHGNLKDLLVYERMFLTGSKLSLDSKGNPYRILFLGDYVDRGKHSLEVSITLFLMKVARPDQVHLVRGNHEIREINRTYTFFHECISKLGPVVGESVYTRINDAFDCLPLAAVVDKTAFCVHGGVPSSNSLHLGSQIRDINCIPCPLRRPEIQSPIAWEMMWNDPLDTDAFLAAIKHQGLRGNEEQEAVDFGFVKNYRRGTGNFFSSDATAKFLNTNHLKTVIRAHEVVQSGHEVSQRGKTHTVFSSSNYQHYGNNVTNIPACVILDGKNLMAQQLDTTIYDHDPGSRRTTTHHSSSRDK